MVADLIPPWETGRLGNSSDAAWPNPKPEAIQNGQILSISTESIRGDPHGPKILNHLRVRILGEDQ